MKTVCEILDEKIYHPTDRDPWAKFYRTSSGQEFEIDDELHEELLTCYGNNIEDFLREETGLTLDEFIEKRARPA
jgi:hypothetical protein